MKRIITNSVDETEVLARDLALSVSKPCFIALFGGMGMGKTAFVRGFCKGIGFEGDVSSPTFSLVHEYHGGKFSVYHFDMYRVVGYESLYSTGFFDFPSESIIICEWSENIEEFLPDNAIRITLSRGEQDDQIIFEIEGDID